MSLVTISIQALYDYKQTVPLEIYRKYLISIQALYDYKTDGILVTGAEPYISIQALYDYKGQILTTGLYMLKLFQFKHCTIISRG